MLLPRILELLILEQSQGTANSAAGVLGHNHIVDKPERPSHKGIGEAFLVFLRTLLDFLRIADILFRCSSFYFRNVRSLSACIRPH